MVECKVFCHVFQSSHLFLQLLCLFSPHITLLLAACLFSSSFPLLLASSHCLLPGLPGLPRLFLPQHILRNSGGLANSDIPKTWNALKSCLRAAKRFVEEAVPTEITGGHGRGVGSVRIEVAVKGDPGVVWNEPTLAATAEANSKLAAGLIRLGVVGVATTCTSDVVA